MLQKFTDHQHTMYRKFSLSYVAQLSPSLKRIHIVQIGLTFMQSTRFGAVDGNKFCKTGVEMIGMRD